MTPTDADRLYSSHYWTLDAFCADQARRITRRLTPLTNSQVGATRTARDYARRELRLSGSLEVRGSRAHASGKRI